MPKYDRNDIITCCPKIKTFKYCPYSNTTYNCPKNVIKKLIIESKFGILKTNLSSEKNE